MSAAMSVQDDAALPGVVQDVVACIGVPGVVRDNIALVGAIGVVGFARGLVWLHLGAHNVPKIGNIGLATLISSFVRLRQ